MLCASGLTVLGAGTHRPGTYTPLPDGGGPESRSVIEAARVDGLRMDDVMLDNRQHIGQDGASCLLIRGIFDEAIERPP